MKQFLCLHCRSPLGSTDGEKLIIPNCYLKDGVAAVNLITLRFEVSLECSCGSIRKWFPSKSVYILAMPHQNTLIPIT